MTAKEATVTFQNDPPNIGSGPWQVVEWKRDDYLRMEAFRDWYDGAPTVDELIFVVYQNGDTMVQDFLSRQPRRDLPVPAGAVRQGRERPRASRRSSTPTRTGTTSGSTATTGRLEGPPGPARPGLPQPPSSTRSTARGSSRTRTAATPCPATRSCRPTRGAIPTTPGRPTRLRGANYDPDKANQILDDAGYVDTNGDGVREYEGRDDQAASVGRPGLAGVRSAPASSSPDGGRPSA